MTAAPSIIEKDSDTTEAFPPGFSAFLLCRIVVSLSFQIAGVAIGWLIYAKTGNAFDLGLVGLFQFLPMAALTFLVGHVADRFDRRRIVAVCEAVGAITLVLLAVGAGSDWLDTRATFAAVAVLGAVRAFEHPTLSTILPGIVSAAALPRALALSTACMQAATIAGPALGGLLYALSPQVPLALAAVFDGVALVAILALHVARREVARVPVSLSSVFAGLHFIRRRPVILGAISLDLFAVLLGGVTALLPIFASDILHTGPLGLGLLRSAPAVGAVAMSLIVGRSGIATGVGTKMFTAVLAFGVATVVFSISTSMIVSILALIVLGAADTVSVVIRHALVQLSTPDSMRGRVLAVNSLFIGTSNQLGEFESGMAAGLFGAVASGVIGGLGTIAIALLWLTLFPSLRRMNGMPTAVTDGQEENIIVETGATSM